MSKIIDGSNGGKHVADGPLTTSLSAEASPSLLLSEIDSRIVKVRPAATPVDQISRLGGTRRVGSMVVDYYSVDTKAAKTQVKSFEVLEDGAAKVRTHNDGIFAPSETVMFPSVDPGSGQPLVAYIYECRPGEGISMVGVNLPEGSAFPTLTNGMEIVRMGRAAGELDVQTPQFEALPVKRSNNCQIFKAQVEESTLQKMTNKEVGWTFSDQEETAVLDMRACVERTFLFGVQRRLVHPVTHEEILLTGGIWNQTDHTFEYDASSDADESFVIDLTRSAFEDAAGSRRKVLVAGTDLIDRLNRIGFTRSIGAADSVTKWGIDFTELKSKFGTLYVVHSETFDQCGFKGYGMVIDPQYLTKYSFIPMQAERLDLKRSGQRNTDAVVITEASCLVLRYPEAHLRIVNA